MRINVPQGIVQALYDHTGTMPHAPGSWSGELRGRLSSALGHAKGSDDDALPCGHPKSDETSADGYTFCAVCAVQPVDRARELALFPFRSQKERDDCLDALRVAKTAYFDWADEATHDGSHVGEGRHLERLWRDLDTLYRRLTEDEEHPNGR